MRQIKDLLNKNKDKNTNFEEQKNTSINTRNPNNSTRINRVKKKFERNIFNFTIYSMLGIFFFTTVAALYTNNRNNLEESLAANPTITGITANAGSISGGDNVTITGTNFENTTNYYREITITNNTGSAISNYEGNIVLDTADLITNSKLQSSCEDIRVKDSDRITDLNYYIDGGCNTESTIIWFTKSSLPVGQSKFYLTYGDNTLANQSNISNFSFGSLLTGLNNQLWLSANVADVSTDNADVSSWTDRSGNSNNATNTGAARPKLETNELDGKPVIRFDGSADYLDADSIVGTFSGSNKPLSTFVVSKVNTGNSFGKVYAFGNTSNFNILTEYTTNSSGTSLIFQRRNAGGSFQNISFGSVTGTDYESLTYINDGSNAEAFKNTTSTGTNSGSFNETFDRFTIGAIEYGPNPVQGFFNGDISEMIFFDSGLNLTDKNIIESYINNKYKLYNTSTIPTTAVSSEITNQLTASFGPGHAYSVPLTIDNQSGSTISNYEGSFVVDTANLIVGGKLNSDCSDIRIKDTDGSTDLNYYIDGGCNSTSTVVWIQKTNLPTGQSTVYLTYGNPTLTSNSNIYNFSFGSILESNNNQLWLSSNVSSTTDDNTPVSSWTDRSGSGNDADQGTGTLQPLLQTNELNGLPVLNFDGSNDQLATNQNILSEQPEFTTFAVAKKETTPNTIPTILGGSTFQSSVTDYYDLSTDNANPTNVIQRVSSPSSSHGVIASTQVANGTPFLVVGSYDGVNNSIAVNDDTFLTAPRTGNLELITNLYVGAADYTLTNADQWRGDIAELIVFNTTALNSTQIQTVQDYLNTKYNLYNTSSIPTISQGSETRVGGKLTNVTVVDTNTITATTPAVDNAGFVDLVISNPDFTSATSTDAFEYKNISVSSISPNSGAIIGGTPVTISGDYFGQVPTTVTFDGVAATNVMVVDSNTITADSPAGVAGSVDIVVSQGGLNTSTLSSGYTYAPVSVNSVNPSSGSTVGGYEVVITGDNFQPGILVFFGGVPGTNINITNPQTLTVTVPENSLGTVDIVLSQNGGLETDTLSGGFTYAAPTISSVAPNSGSTVGGTNITISGNNFATGNSYVAPITISNNSGSAISNYEGNITVDSSTLVTAGKMNSDCSDIRIKDTDGSTDLNYYIDGGCNTESTIIWFTKSSLPVGQSKFYLTYGDNTLANQSNISNFSFGSILTNPSNITWYSANIASTSTDNTDVDLWIDRSGSGNDAGETGTLRPTLQTNEIDGKPVVQFDGIEDLLVSANNGNSLNINSGSLFTVARSDDAGASNRGVFVKATAYGIFYNDNKLSTYDWGSNNQRDYSTENIADGSAKLLGYTFDSGVSNGSNLYLNGVPGTPFTNTILGQSFSAAVGNGQLQNPPDQQFDGDIAEVILFDNIVSSTDMQIVEDYLNNKYKLYNTSTIPTTAVSSEITNQLTASFGPGHAYSVPLTIDNQSGSAISNYEGSFVLDTANLISGGKLNGDCSDLRIKDTDETSDLNYYIDGGCNSTSTVVWIQKTNLPTGQSTVYLTYGNPTLTSNSNIYNFSFGSILESNNNQLWLSSNVSNTVADNTPVSSWLDRSGNGNDAVQGTGANQPSLQTNEIYGKPVLNFDGDDYFTTNLNALDNFSIFSVIEIPTLPSISAYTFGTNNFGANRQSEQIIFTDGTLRFFQNDGAGGNISRNTTGVISPNNPTLLSSTKSFSSGELKMGINGTTEVFSSLAFVPKNNTETFQVGRIQALTSNLFNGNLAEGLIFDTDLNDSDRGIVETYLNIKYRLYNTSSIPTISQGSETRIGGQLTNVTVVDTNTITATTPAVDNTGFVDLVITNPDFSSVTSTDAFEYKNISVSSISPNSGAIIGGTPVTISGDYFGQVPTTVTFDGVAATNVMVVDSNTITATTPAHTPGQVDVTVTLSNGESDTLTNGFEYKKAEINNLSPNDGHTGGGYEVTVNGDFFLQSGIFKEVQIDNTGGEQLTNYQVSFTLDTNDLINNSKMRTDCGDLRVQTLTGSDLPYWIEDGTCNDTATVIWTKLPSIDANSIETIKVVYGDLNKTSTANGDNVFLFYDSFDAENTDKFNYPASQYYSYANGEIAVNSNGSNYFGTSSKTLLNANDQNIRYVQRSRQGSAGSQWHSMLIQSGNGSDYQRFAIVENGTNNAVFQKAKNNSYTNSGLYSLPVTPGYYRTRVDITKNSNSITGYAFNDSGSQISTHSDSSATWLNREWNWVTIQNGTDINYIDYVYATTFSSVLEPSTSVSSTEQGGVNTLSIGSTQVTDFTFVDEQTLTFTAPSGVVGQYDVVFNDYLGNTTTLTNGFEYKAPEIISITPNSGSTTGQYSATITGNYFFEGGVYNVPLTITNSTGSAITNYEGNITLDTATLINEGKINNSCSDIRIKDTDGSTDLNYYIDGGCNTDSTVIWFAKSSLPTGDTTIYLNYGSGSLTSTSDISNFSFGGVLSSANNKAWVSANEGLGFQSGSEVNSWSDRSGNSNDFVDDIANAGYPTRVANQLDGKPHLFFDGDDGLNLSGDLGIALDEDRTFFLVSEYTTNELGNEAFGVSTQNMIDFGNFTNNNRLRLRNATTDIYSNNNTVPINTDSVVSGIGNATGTLAYRNGVEIINTTDKAFNYEIASQFSIGWSTWLGSPRRNFTGNISEFIMFETDLGATDRQTIETYLNSKYKLYNTSIFPSIVIGSEVLEPISVNIGSNPATDIVLIDSQTINLTIPGGNSGQVDVIVTNPDGTTGSLVNGFEYGSPEVISITPNQGPDSGGTFVTVLGNNFTDVSDFDLDLTINNPTGSAITDYEGNVTIDTASLIAAGKMNSDCSDLRVRDTDGTTELDYYLESGCNTTNTSIWFKVPSLATGNSTIFINYGDPARTNQSNINNFSFAVLESSNNQLWLDAAAAANGTLEDIQFANEVNVTTNTNDAVKNSGVLAWNAGFTSVQTITSGNGYASYQVSSDQRDTIFGLSTGNSDPNYININFAINVDAGNNVRIFESGTNRGNFGGTVMQGDTLSVEVIGSDVVYKKNNQIIYTSAVSPTYPLYADSSIYGTTSGFDNIQICNGTCEGSTIATWNDKSGNGYVASQSDLTKSPILESNFSNNKPGISFDGQVDGDILNTNFTPVATDDLTVFAIANRDTQTTDAGSCCRPIVSSGENSGAMGATSNHFWITTQREDATNPFAIRAEVDQNQIFDNTAFQSDDNKLSTLVVRPGTSFDLYVDGTQIGSTVTGVDQTTPDPVDIGGEVVNLSRRFAGSIPEVIIFNTELNTTQRQSIENFLNTKYRLYNTSNLPTITTGSETGNETELLIGGNQATNVTVVDTQTITAFVPAGTGLVDVVVNDVSGNTGTLSNGYTYGVAIEPNAITDLAATANTNTANLTWTAPFDNGSPITDYIIEYSTSSDFSNPTTFNDGVNTNTNVDVTGLSFGEDYYFRVFAVNGVGQSDPSNSANITSLSCDTNLNGADLTTSNGQVLSGIYCNVGVFTVPASTTATLATESYVEILANSVDISGTINGLATGYRGGNAAQDGNGPGAGQDDGSGTCGRASAAGHGGRGGRSYNSSAQPGGAVYGSVTQPTEFGSGGAGTCTLGSAPGYRGGHGGGAIKIVSATSTDITGTINVNGESWTTNNRYFAAGAGGSVWIETQSFTGNGSIFAEGGRTSDNNEYYGGAGGGRIAIYHDTDTYTGVISARGGSAIYSTSQAGGAGTIYQKQTSQTYGDLTIDNTGIASGSGGITDTPINNQYLNLAGLNNLNIGDRTLVNVTDDLAIEDGISLGSNNTFNQNANFTLSSTFTSFNLASNNTYNQNGDFTASNVNSFDIQSSSSYSVGGALTLSTTADLTINGTLTTRQNTTNQDYVIDLSINNLTVSSGGSINLNGRGYRGGIQNGCNPNAANGPGAGTTHTTFSSNQFGSGAGHGGTGGDTNYAGGGTYGSITEPVNIGSGGAASSGSCGGAQNGGAGGGAVKITVTGTATIDGTITANGNNGSTSSRQSGAGSGGSIWIAAQTLTGTGTVRTNGGDSFSSAGSGGGGRIALYYDTRTFSGTIESNGGGVVSGNAGAAGTIYEKQNSDAYGTVIIDNTNGVTSSETTPIDSSNLSSLNTLDELVVANKANAVISKPLTVNNTNLDLDSDSIININSEFTIPNITTWTIDGDVFQNSQLNTPALTDLTINSGGSHICNASNPDNWFSALMSNITIDGTLRLCNYSFPTLNDLTINSGGLLDHKNNTTSEDYVIDISTASFTLNSGGSINLNGRGYNGGLQNECNANPGSGPGGGNVSPSFSGNQFGSGGGYGGAGGNSNFAGGSTYGSISEPVNIGSGGAASSGGCGGGQNGGAGGGAVKITVTGTATIDGTITANGSNGSTSNRQSGGGSGGSIWITAQNLAGSGTVRTNGGDSFSSAGSGGGGRIALYYDTRTFSGTVESNGGGVVSGNAGAAGTIYEPNVPESGLANANLSPIPNPVSIGATFQMNATNILNIQGFDLFSGACDITITGPGGYNQSITGGTVSNGTCTLPSQFNAPTITGAYDAAITVIGNDLANTTESNTIQFDVFGTPSNKAEEDSGNAAQPTLATFVATPTLNVIGRDLMNFTVTGLIDSATGQTLNGIPCAFNVTGPSSYSASFVSANAIGGECSYDFTQFELPTVIGSYDVTVSVEGDSGTLTSSSINFTQEYDIQLTGGLIPGNNSVVPDPIDFNGADPVFSSPVLYKHDGVSFIDTGTACKTIMIIGAQAPVEYNSVVNNAGQCVNTIMKADIISGVVDIKTEVTLDVNGTNVSFETAQNQFTSNGFPSNKAEEDSGNAGQPTFTSSTFTPSPSYIDNDVTLSVTGLVDSANLNQLNNSACIFNVTGPNSFTYTDTGAVVGGDCSIVIDGDTQLPIEDGTFSFTVDVDGDSGVLTVPTTNFDRNYDIDLNGGLIDGVHTSTQNPILVGSSTTIQSPIIRRANGFSGISNGTDCKIIYQLNSLTPIEYIGTTSASRCTAVIPSVDITTDGTATVKTQVSLFGNDFNPEYTFETANTVFTVRFAANSQICANPTFRDDNNNQVRDGSEPLLPGVVTRLRDNGGVVIDTLTTTATGPNCFTNLFDDDYTIEQDAPAGGTRTVPATNSYDVTLGVNDNQDRIFGYNGDADICPNPTYIDDNEDGTFNGADFYLPNQLVKLFLATDLVNEIATLVTTNNASSPCFTDITPGDYVLEQPLPANSNSTTGGTVNGTDIRQSVTHSFGTQTDQQFGFEIIPSGFAEEDTGNPGQPIHISVDLETSINPTYNEQAFVGYPVSASVTGLQDSSTSTPLNGIGICDATFSGPSFVTPITVTGQDVVNGTCEISNANNNNGTVIPDTIGTGNIVTFTVDGESGTLSTPDHFFDVDQAVTTVCVDTFADYNGNSTQDSNEPQISGISVDLIQNPGSTVVQTITTTLNSNDCFTPANIDPSTTYDVVQVAPAGASLTGGLTQTQATNAVPDDGSTINNADLLYPYQGDSNITPISFRDDNQNSTNDSEPIAPGLTATLKDAFDNTISSFTIDNTTSFNNLLSSSINSGDYSIEINTGSLNVTATTTVPRSVTLSNGSSINEEFGYYSGTNICPNPTFYDYDGDGIRDGIEQSINGFTTNLVRVSDSTVVQTFTNNNTTCFTDVIPDNYRVEQIPLAGAVLTSQNNISGNVSTGNQSGGTGTVATFPVIAVFGINETVRYGYIGSATICPYPTFQDLDSNGTQSGAGEIDITGVNTELLDNSGEIISSLSTDGGITCFTDVLSTDIIPSGFRVQQTQPANTVSTTGGNSINVTSLTATQNLDIPFGYNGDPYICPVVYRDDNNDGIFNNSETRLAGSTILLKDQTGTTTLDTMISSTIEQCFGPLALGTYVVESGGINNYTATTVETRNSTLTFATNDYPEFGYNGDSIISVTQSFEDANKDGNYDVGETLLAGLDTQLRLTPTGTPLQTVTTDINGSVTFAPVSPGQYVITQTAPNGTTSTTGAPYTINLQPSQNQDLVFGYTGNATICADPTWDDTDFDRVFDSSENKFVGVQTELFLTSDLINPIETLNTTAGSNCFLNLLPGDYRVVQTAPVGYSSTTGGSSQDITIVSNDFEQVQFGYTNNPDFALGAIFGFLYIDRDENGNYDPFGADSLEVSVFDNDVPVVDQLIELYKFNVSETSFDLVDTVNSDSEGNYVFTALTPGDYEVRVPSALGLKSIDPNPSIRPITIPSDDKFYDTDMSFEYIARICPVLFVDVNNNQQFDSGTDVDIIAEEGRYYQLQYQSFNGTQTASNGNANGWLINSANPCIEEIPPRDYTLVVRAPGTGNVGTNNPGGANLAFYDQFNGNKALTIFLGSDLATENYYFSNFVVNQNVSTIQGRVWNNRPRAYSPAWDETFDADGSNNLTGTSGGFNYDWDNDFAYGGIGLTLFKCGDGFMDPTPTATWNANPPTTTTASDGTYSFTGVTPGRYAVLKDTVLPQETSLVNLRRNSCGNATGNLLANDIFINNTFDQIGGVAPGSTITHDWATRYGATIDNDLYLDSNNNGIRDGSEQDCFAASTSSTTCDTDLQGDLVLRDSNGNIVEILNSETQYSHFGSLGRGKFPSVPPDNYTIELTNDNSPFPPISPTELNKNVNILVQEDELETYGFLPPEDSTVTGLVYINRFGSGGYQVNGPDGNLLTTYDNDELVGGVMVELLNTANVVIDTVTTDTSGSYTFNLLREGFYTIRVVSPAPTGTSCSQCSYQIYLPSSDINTGSLTYDYNGTAVLDAFFDTVADGLWDESADNDDPAEVNVEGFNFRLTYNADGTVVQTIDSFTNDPGNARPHSQYCGNNYCPDSYKSLKPGDYTVELINLPTGYTVSPFFSNPDTINILPSESFEKDYGFEPETDNTISGNIYVDRGVLNNAYDPDGADGNGSLTFDNETPLGATDIFIIGPLGSYTITSAADGSYSISNLPSGIYKLHTYNQSDTAKTNPIPFITITSSLANAIKDECIDAIRCRRYPNGIGESYEKFIEGGLEIRSSENISNDYTYLYTNTIFANYIDDLNGDGQITFYANTGQTEGILSGVGTDFELETPTGEVLTCSGNYQFSPTNAPYTICRWGELPPGNYIIKKLNDKSGYTNVNTTVSTSTPTTSNSGVSRGDIANVNTNVNSNSINQVYYHNYFQFIEPITNNSSITGKVFFDRNSDGVFDEDGDDNDINTVEDNDAIIPGIILDLTGQLTRTTNSAADGKYQFTDLPQGIYNISSNLVQGAVDKVVRIDNITLINGGNDYQVSFTSLGFTPSGATERVHFYWDTQKADVGTQIVTTDSPYVVSVSSKPVGANRLCVVVADSANTIIPHTGDCYPVP